MPSIKFKQSKENARWLKLYEESEIYSLKQVYNSCSSLKVEAYEDIKNNYINYDITDRLKILTYNKTRVYCTALCIMTILVVLLILKYLRHSINTK